VSEIVADARDTLHGKACAKGVSLYSDLRGTVPAAYADPIRLRQILIILTDNAIKFTPFSGTVKIGVRPWGRDTEFLCIEVSDTGCGIDSKHVERIFDRLYQSPDPTQSNRQGLGLGLFICKELVTRHGGQIWVESRLHEGSTFSFTLPIFSLKKLMAPLLKNNKWPRESAALVSVEIHGRKECPSDPAQKEWTREVRALIRSCLLPNLDVLLPQMNGQGDGERFRVAAFADEQGASVLSRRIQEQLEGRPQLTGSGSTVTVSPSMLKAFALSRGEAMDDIAATLVVNLEEAIRSSHVVARADD
jgi:hypothetical protein